MTGAEHYEEAERLLEVVSKDIELKSGRLTYYDPDDDTRVMIEAAQVHATLALAAHQRTLARTTAEFVDGAMGDYPPQIRTLS